MVLGRRDTRYSGFRVFVPWVVFVVGTPLLFPYIGLAMEHAPAVTAMHERVERRHRVDVMAQRMLALRQKPESSEGASP